MYELIKLTEHDYYFECPAKIGLVRINDSEVVLIDSGNDKDAAKKVLRAIDAEGWTVKAIYNTHSHADHIGGNKHMQDKTGCAIYAKGLECSVANAPVFEPIGLYGGLPFKALKNKFLMAKESVVQPLTAEVLPEGWELIELPGHCFEMVGFRTPDGSAYIGDVVSSEETLAKYGIGYLWDAEASLASLETLKSVEAERFIPAHAAVCEDICALADVNIASIRGVQEKVLELCAEPHTFEELLKEIFDAYGMQMTAQQYALIGSTLRSYMSGLLDKGALKYDFVDNEMVWLVNAD